MKTKVTTSICRHHLIQTQAWRVPIYMHRHNDYDDVKDNADGDAVVNAKSVRQTVTKTADDGILTALSRLKL